jgi:hypothetical protein
VEPRDGHRLLTEYRLEHLGLAPGAGDLAGAVEREPVNAVLTFHGMNPFAACARAIELHGLIPNPQSPTPARPRSKRAAVAPQTPLGEEIARLLAEAREARRDPKSQFTLVAIPAPAVGGLRVQECAGDSPDAGQFKDGVFHWPLKSWQNCGDATIDGLGAYVFLALAPTDAPLMSFAAFSGRATAALRAAAPGWAGAPCPKGVYSNWAATAVFGAPSARNRSARQSTGPHVLTDPWAASIAALSDIISPPRTTVPSDICPGPPVVAGSGKKPGRPRDRTKQKVVNFVRRLRAKKTPWKTIPDAVFEKFKVRYSSETSAATSRAADRGKTIHPVSPRFLPRSSPVILPPTLSLRGGS